jgi:hypothetical protein
LLDGDVSPGVATTSGAALAWVGAVEAGEDGVGVVHVTGEPLGGGVGASLGDAVGSAVVGTTVGVELGHGADVGSVPPPVDPW